MLNYELAFNEIQRYSQLNDLKIMRFEDIDTSEAMKLIGISKAPAKYIQIKIGTDSKSYQKLSIYYDKDGVCNLNYRDYYEVFDMVTTPIRFFDNVELLEYVKHELDKMIAKWGLK